MSTEHQQYSTENQAQAIREYAEQRGIRIIKTYSDDAKSGLIIGGRMALQQMIADVESGEAEFSVILVYDVTYWGRFQDTDRVGLLRIPLSQGGDAGRARSRLKTTARPIRPSSRASSAPWLANTAASFRSRSSLANAA
ncbi:recombinase family protein [Paracoccus sp. TOH]|uniref:recombinase family protein n=1 Tax=Paracoccus sp. TOH TaxID=1263728 RepID=UPI00339D9175